MEFEFIGPGGVSGPDALTSSSELSSSLTCDSADKSDLSE